MRKFLSKNGPELRVLWFLIIFAAALFITPQAHAQSAGNVYCTVLSAAVRTATTTSADQQNTQWKGVHVITNVSPYTSGTFTPKIQGKDVASGQYYDILIGAGIAGVSTSVLKLYPGIQTAGQSAVSDILPRVWRISVGSTTPASANYSVGCSLIM